MDVSATGSNTVQTNVLAPRQEVSASRAETERLTAPQDSQTLSTSSSAQQGNATPQTSDPNQRVGSIVDIQV
ncbi:hypothetical protein [Paraglaciecola chathamensis]|uniref:Uncharacterized protein n=1 Tax=Paraglaciecola chathamensis S18K6 TaxID=1127672 RepID=A0AAV3V454_9ALTE|nr:hypothetical protein [Paraglaciecola chathamensis]GAC11587.1 hypothetical protein GCHA_3657 [Paraglaciecola chathamensis S18K6]